MLNYDLGHCERHWYEQDATADQGFIAKINSYFEKQVRFHFLNIFARGSMHGLPRLLTTELGLLLTFEGMV